MYWDVCDCHKWKSNVTDRKMSTGMVIECNIPLLANDMKSYSYIKLELPQYASGLKYGFQ